METVRRFGGAAGLIIAIAGAGVVSLAPQQKPYGWVLSGMGGLIAVVAAWLNRGDLANLAKGRPFRHGANAIFYSLLVIGIVAAVDFLAARHSKRFDLTEEGIYSLSPQTVKIVKGLDQNVTIIAFYSLRAGGRQQASDLLDEYRHNNPRITVRFVDPFQSPAEARNYEIEVDPTIVVATGSGEARVTPSTLKEEDLTNALLKATAGERKVVCISSGHGESGLEDSAPEGLGQAAEAIRKENFEVREVRLFEGDATLDGCSSLLVPGPSKALLQPEVEAVERYLDAGGRLLVLAEPRTPTGLEELLKRYGLVQGDDFIVDVNPMGRLFGGSPAAPVVSDYGSHAITKDLQGIVTIFPTVSSISTTTPEETQVTTETLARTSAQSWGEKGELAERVSFEEGQDTAGPLDIGALAVRRIATEPPEEGAAEPESGHEARVVLFGDSDFASNAAFGALGNSDLLLNTVAWLNESADLISVRPKTRPGQQLVLNALQARALWIFDLVVFPVLILATGVGVWLRRRRL